MPATIVKYNEDVINFLEDVNYGLTKPQFNHLSTMGYRNQIPVPQGKPGI